MIGLILLMSSGMLSADTNIIIESTRCQMTIGDEGRQGIISLVDLGTGQEYAAVGKTLYELQSDDGMFLTSDMAESVERIDEEDNRLRLDFKHEGGVIVHIVFETPPDSPFIQVYGAFSLPTPKRIKMFRYPVLMVPEDFGGNPEEQVVISPQAGGYLARNPKAQNFGWSEQMYPGYASLQMITLYDAKGGVYYAAHDDAGHIKAIGPSCPDKKDYRLSQRAHFPLTPLSGTTVLSYPVAITTYQGDWHDAADLYKSWAKKQWWCRKTWVERDDLPQWYKDSPVVAGFFLADREHDGWYGPVKAIKTPEYIVKRLNDAANRFDATILAWFLDWEKNGAWRGADYFPPMMGWDKFDQLQSEMYSKGMHGAANFSTYYWVYEWSEEPGQPPVLSNEDLMLKEFGDVLCRNEDGSLYEREVSGWQNTSGVRHTAKLCRTPEKTKKYLLRCAETMMDHGWDMIHYDQENSGGICETFCASEDHGHVPGYGEYMWKDFADLLRRTKIAGKKRDMDVVISIEEPQELFIPVLDTFQIRDFYTNIKYGPYTEAIPLFHYVYHEYNVGFCSKLIWGSAPGYRFQEVARAVVAGDIPGIAFENVPAEDRDDEYGGVFQYIESWHEARSTFAKDFLAFGSMHKPLDLHVPYDTRPVMKSSSEAWDDGRRMHIPWVANSTWTSVDGRWGAVIASGAMEPMTCRVDVADLPKAETYRFQSQKWKKKIVVKDGAIEFEVRPKTVYLLTPKN